MAEAGARGGTGVRIPVTSQEVMDFLGCIPLLQQLPGTSVQKIAEVVEQIHFGKGEMLLREGSPGEGLYFLWKGEAEVSLPITQEKLGHTMPVLKPGDCFGSATAGPIKTFHQADVIAITEVLCFVLRHENADLLSSVSIWRQQLEKGGDTLLERILQVETLEVDLYQGYTCKEYPSIRGSVYGGQLLGQALAAASKSVNPGLLVHSLHSYFLQTGDIRFPIIYNVDRIRDDHTFATRHVLAMQKGRTIFTMFASFQRHEEGIGHQEPMPSSPTVDQVLSAEDLQKIYYSDPRIPMKDKQISSFHKNSIFPLDIKLVDPADRVTGKATPAWQRVWMKSKGRLADEPALHRCAAVYASDWTFLPTAYRPHGHVQGRVGMRVLSLDHSMWFHKPFRADEWLLFVQSSPRVSNSRGLSFGHFYTQSGELVMSASQEGLLRAIKPERETVSKL